MTTRRDVLALAALGMAAGAVRPAKAAAPAGQLTYGVHITLAPTWLDPAETAGITTPFMLMYALHDAIAKPMPQGNPSPSLAELWSAGEDGLSYEFVLRKDAKFHNGDPVTADDVKFSFERYRGAAHGLLKERVASVDAPDPQRVVFKLKNPWPDFITFYTVASGAGWVVPRKYVEKVGEDGFKKAPIGAGPYKFVSFTPGIERVLEAFDQYWRKTPSVKRIVLRVIPDESTRLAALKNGEVDIAYSIRAELAEELRRTPGLTLRPTVGSSPHYMYFPEQWDPKSPWYDRRVRLATKYARLQHDQQGADAGLFAHHRQCHSGELRVLREAGAAGVRSGRGEAASGGGGACRRLRCRLLYLRCGLREPWRGRGELSGRGRYPRQAAAAGARSILQGLRRKEIQEHHPGPIRRVRQCRDTAGGVRGQGR